MSVASRERERQRAEKFGRNPRNFGIEGKTYHRPARDTVPLSGELLAVTAMALMLRSKSGKR